MENFAFFWGYLAVNWPAFDFKAIKLVSNPPVRDIAFPKTAKAVKKVSTINFMFKVFRCISKQKINEYWQINIW